MVNFWSIVWTFLITKMCRDWGRFIWAGKINKRLRHTQAENQFDDKKNKGRLPKLLRKIFKKIII